MLRFSKLFDRFEAMVFYGKLIPHGSLEIDLFREKRLLGALLIGVKDGIRTNIMIVIMMVWENILEQKLESFSIKHNNFKLNS